MRKTQYRKIMKLVYYHSIAIQNTNVKSFKLHFKFNSISKSPNGYKTNKKLNLKYMLVANLMNYRTFWSKLA